jgi:hypothetical protein
MSQYKAKIFINETQVHLSLIFNQLQLERMMNNLEQGDSVKYLGEASDAEDAAEVLGLSKFKKSDQDLYYYIAATFVTMATSIYELQIYREGLVQILSEEEVDSKTKELVEKILEAGDELYLKNENQIEEIGVDI